MESDRLCGGKKKKPEICLWKELTLFDVDVLQRATSVEECQRILSRVLRVESRLSEPRVAVLLDLFYYLLQFCQDQGFSREQTSCLFSVLTETHAACVDSPLGSPDDCFARFQNLILRHAVHRPPFSLSLFSQQQVQVISQYFINTYLCHFKLYKYVFTPQVHLDLSICYEGIHEPAVSVGSEPGMYIVPGVRAEDAACERPEPENGGASEEEDGMAGRINVKEGVGSTLLE